MTLCVINLGVEMNCDNMHAIIIIYLTQIDKCSFNKFQTHISSINT